jgi:hypothetical protein
MVGDMADNFRNFDDNNLAQAAEQRNLARLMRKRQWEKIGITIGTVAAIGAGITGLVFLVRAAVKDNYANLEYRFDGTIDGEQVRFYESWTGETNYLDVVQKDGTQLYFEDNMDDFIMNSVQIKNDTIDTKFDSNDSENPYMVENMKRGQELFDSYLKKIEQMNSLPLNTDK